jgi:hypothetical protein
MASAHWEMVVTRLGRHTSLTVRGPETKGTTASCPADGEWVAIRFTLGTFMPLLPPGRLRDLNDVTLPAAGDRSFWLNGSAWEYPNFENADTFVNRLVRRGLIAVDLSVRTALFGDPLVWSLRTTERRVLRATGVTQGAIRQIERARHATSLLSRGVSILDTVGEAGYYDQAHLTRSLRRLVGLTPAQVRRAERQLSFSYKTSPPWSSTV